MYYNKNRQIKIQYNKHFKNMSKIEYKMYSMKQENEKTHK